MKFMRKNFKTKEATPYTLVASHYGAVREGEVPYRRRACAGCAQCGTHPKGGDCLQAPAPLSDAVPEGDAP